MVTADHHAPYIKCAIESVIYQTFEDWELIIVDDGPIGKAISIVDRYNDPRIRYIKQEHVGVWFLGTSYNRALAQARSPFIAILEGDDWWPNNKLEIQIPEMQQNNAVLSYGIGEAISADGKAKLRTQPPSALRNNLRALRNEPIGSIAVAMACHWQFLSPPCIVLRKDALDRISGFQQPDYYPAVDFPTTLQLAALGSFHYMPTVLGYSRMHANSVTASYIPGAVYLVGMFRCWAEIVKKSKIRVSKSDAELIISHWRPQLFGYYLTLGRQSLTRGNRGVARKYFIHAYAGARGYSRLASLGGLIITYMPLSVGFLEAVYRFAKRKTISDLESEGMIDQSYEIVSAFENLVSGLNQMYIGGIQSNDLY